MVSTIAGEDIRNPFALGFMDHCFGKAYDAWQAILHNDVRGICQISMKDSLFMYLGHSKHYVIPRKSYRN